MYFINKENNEVSTAVSDKAYDNTDGKFLNVDMTKVQNDVAEALLINIDYRKTEAELQALLDQGFLKLRLPIYMKFSETPSGNAEGDTTRTLAGLQRLSVFDASKDITDNVNPAAGNIATLHNGEWNNIEFDLTFLLTHYNDKCGLELGDVLVKKDALCLRVRVCDRYINGKWVTDSGGRTPTQFSIGVLTAIRGGATIDTRAFDNGYGGFDYNKAEGVKDRSYYIGEIGGKQSADSGFIKYTSKRVGGEGTDGFGPCWQRFRTVAPRGLCGDHGNLTKWIKRLKDKGYTHIRYSLLVQVDDERVIAENGNKFSYKFLVNVENGGYFDLIPPIEAEINKWTEVDIPIDDVIHNLTVLSGDDHYRSSDFAILYWSADGIEGNDESIDLYFDGVRAVKSYL